MQSRTVFLLPSDELGWRDVRHALAQMPHVTVIEEGHGRDAGDLATLPPPDLICAATAREGQSTAPFLDAFHHRGGDTSRVALFATDFDPHTLASFAPFTIAGHVRWRDLCAQTLPACLTLLLAGTMHISSPVAHDTATAMHRPLAGPPPEVRAVSVRERRILTRMATGVNQNQVARDENLSLRTVKRSVADLHSKLDAPGLFALGVRAAEVGLVSSSSVGIRKQ